MYPYSNSKITLELRDLLSSTDENGQPFKLWDFDYPSFYQGEEKTAFEQKVIDHYLFRQIGAETPGRFKHNFRTRIREIMPYYIQLYKSVEIMEGIDDPFGNVDIVETFEEESSGSSTGSQSSTSSGTSDTTETGTTNHSESLNKSEDTEQRKSNTPMGSVDNLDNYLSEALRENKTNTESSESETGTSSSVNASTSTESEGTSSTSNTGTVKHTLTKKGNQGVNTYAHDMIELRQTFLNVDLMIIKELNDLFLRVY